MRRIVLAALVIAACTNDATQPTTVGLSFSVVSGDGQSGVVGQPLPNPLVIKATDSRGRPQKNLQVSFIITSGGGSANPVSARTDQNGFAQTAWTLGTSVAQAQGLEARAGSALLGAFSATPLVGPPAQLAIQAGDGQSAAHNTPVSVVPSVAVRDQYGNAVPGASVSFTVTAGGGSVTGSPATSAADGVATLGSWMLGSTVGTNTLRASVAGASPATFTATATPGAAVRLTLAAGDNQTAEANTQVPIPPAVRVADAAGNAVAGIRVTFVPILGGNFVHPDTASSGPDGVAAPSFWMLGTRTGSNTMRATASGIADTVIFHATATSGPVDADHSGIGAQPDKITTSNTSRIYVIARSRILNPVPGATVVFEATGAGNTIVQPSSPTDSAGYAEGQFSSTVLGQKIVSATINGIRITPTWTVTVQGGPPADLSLYAGNNQTAQVNTNVPIAPAVLIRDANGNPVPDVIATFVIIQGGGSVGGSQVAQVASGQNGVAAVSFWRFGTTTGANKLRATVQGIADSVVFLGTATAGPPASVTIRAGNNQVGYTNTALPTSPSVTVKDAFNNLVPGAAVTFAITEGNGTIAGTNPVPTDAAGVATVGAWVLGPAIGTNRMTATAGGASPVTLTATAQSGPPTSVEIHGGNTQTAKPNEYLPIEPSVLVRDASGNPVDGVRVRWAVTSGEGSPGNSYPTTVAGGIAAAIWRLGPVLGTQTLVATVEGEGISGNPVTFTATAVGDFWRRLASAPTHRMDAAGEAIDGKLYVVGGIPFADPLQGAGDMTGLVEVYDPATNSWTTRSPMPTPRASLGVGVINGILYAVGGWHGGPLAAVEAYDPATDTWTQKAPLPTALYDLSVTVINGVLYAVGGAKLVECSPSDPYYPYCNNYETVATVQAYDPVTDTWTQKADMLTPRQFHASAAVNGILYAFGGQWHGVNDYLAAVESYDPATNTWTARAPMPTARFGHGAGVIGGIIYVAGGSAVNEAYDPATDSWTTKAPMLERRQEFASAVINGVFYVAGGTSSSASNWSLKLLDAYHP